MERLRVSGSEEQSNYRSLAGRLREARQVRIQFDFAPFLRAARAKLNMSQAELARRCNISEATVRRHERENQPVTESLEKIVEFFETEGIEFVLPNDGSDCMAGIRWEAGFRV